MFLTGIGRFGKVNLFSALNNLQDISEDPRYATLCGFTEQEVAQYLTSYLVQIADNIGWSLQDLWSYMQESYNGYQFSASRTDVEQVYNPFTLLSSLNEWLQFDSDQAWREGQLTHHWANSGNPSLLMRLIAMGRYCAPPEKPDLKSLRRVSYDLEQLDYTALMWQTGYFTFRGGQDGEPLRLDYPNREVRDTCMRNLWEHFHGVGARWPEKDKLYPLYHALENQDYGAFCTGLLPLIAGIPGAKLKEESDFHIIMDVLAYVMQLTCPSEGAVWGGRFDQAHEFENHVCVIELKYNRTAPEALAQIRTRRYIDKFRDRGVPFVGLGLNFVKDGTAASPRSEHKVQTLYDPSPPARQSIFQGNP